jgi:hypothetical protein
LVVAADIAAWKGLEHDAACEGSLGLPILPIAGFFR